MNQLQTFKNDLFEVAAKVENEQILLMLRKLRNH